MAFFLYFFHVLVLPDFSCAKLAGHPLLRGWILPFSKEILKTTMRQLKNNYAISALGKHFVHN
jgi:hypothetical protein